MSQRHHKVRHTLKHGATQIPTGPNGHGSTATASSSHAAAAASVVVAPVAAAAVPSNTTPSMEQPVWTYVPHCTSSEEEEEVTFSGDDAAACDGGNARANRGNRLHGPDDTNDNEHSVEHSDEEVPHRAWSRRTTPAPTAAAAMSSRPPRPHWGSKRPRPTSPTPDPNKRSMRSSNATAVAATDGDPAACQPPHAKGIRLPTQILDVVSGFLGLPSVALLARTDKQLLRQVRGGAMMQRVYEADGWLRRRTPLPMKLRAVWRSPVALRLIAQEQITLKQLKGFMVRRRSSPRSILLQALNLIASAQIGGLGDTVPHLPRRTSVLELFASGRLDLHRFEGLDMYDVGCLLQPPVELVVRSGWLSQDMLFRLHAVRNPLWTPSVMLTKPNLLDRLMQIRGGQVLLCRMAVTFAPLTDACIEQLKNDDSPVVDGLVERHFQTAERLLQRLGPVPPFTFARFSDHLRASEQLPDLRRHILHRCDRPCPCVCAAGDINQDLCICDHIVGCKRQRVQRFQAAQAERAARLLFPEFP